MEFVRNRDAHPWPGHELEFGLVGTVAGFVVYAVIAWLIKAVTGIPWRSGDLEKDAARKIKPRFKALSILDQDALYGMHWELRSCIHSLTAPYLALWIMVYASPEILVDPVTTTSWYMVLLLSVDVGYYCYDMFWMVYYKGEFDIIFFAHHVVALSTYGPVLFTGTFVGIGAVTYLYHIPTVVGNILTYYTNARKERSIGHKLFTAFILLLWIPCRFGATVATGYVVYVHWTVISLMPKFQIFSVIVFAVGFMALFNTVAFVQYSQRLMRSFGSERKVEETKQD
ncbi:uncharacterized protein AMSG_10110 [Thecamonas trahens ATCC 50062]|uniref:TLC domain-containing protein n=1 Tax=Thecamonas trahens ATCC 50062 TaxID=461836 RepID=A0A0L0DQ45_THETB|nr:hypothetical protein AMSG_10110 [Thecamonas trahens ATCC 50062]KNC54390.1 hypothetical protein AMSG_10110 [Thecamonas trahens ATCC 50062]|eukprot:XP_013753689.1 hypothetical protein AMSG_10110 [Thecamonas trahens ATCC 50062]